MDWRDKAACLTVDPELFFPVGNTGPAVDQIEKAKAVCARCTVTEICLQYALESGQDSGVWGSLSEDERRAFETDGLTAYRQVPLAVVLPRSTEEVSRVMAFLHGAGVKVIPRGAGTSLSFGISTLGVGALMLAMGRLINANRQLESARIRIGELAVEAERERFARDLHDVLGHSLSLQVSGGEVVLGQWQRIVMAELDGPRSRTIRISVMGIA